MYFSGQQLTGSVELVLHEAKSYNYIQVQIHGGAEVKWSETYTTGSGEDERTETVTYSAYHTYVDETTVLWRKEQTPHGKIGPGSYKFPFSFTLPSQCASSFTGSVGTISYDIRGRIGTGLFRFDRRTYAPIKVSQIVDINVPQLLAPVRQTQVKDVGCLCCISGNVELSAAIPRSGFCINGDRIPLTVMVENGCTQDISLRAAVLKTISYYAEGKEKYDYATIAFVNSRRIPRNSTHTWNPENLIIRSVETTLDSPGAIITIQYTLKITAQVPYAFDPCIRIPIVLGNVPYQGTAETAVATPTIGFSFQPDPERAHSQRPGVSVDQIDPERICGRPGATAPPAAVDRTDGVLYQDAPPDYYQACGYGYSKLK